MESSDFITKQEYLGLLNKIQNKQDFEFKKEIKKVIINMHSAKASCDWNNATKKDDYIICLDKIKNYGSMAGSSSPYEYDDIIKQFLTYEKLFDNIDRWLDREVNKVKVVKLKENIVTRIELTFGEQISIFDMEDTN